MNTKTLLSQDRRLHPVPAQHAERPARGRAPEQELCGAGPAVCMHCGDAAPLQPSQLSPSHCRLVSCPRAASTRTQFLTDCASSPGGKKLPS